LSGNGFGNDLLVHLGEFARDEILAKSAVDAHHDYEGRKGQ
jgi:hypothetical protein